jgi:hypothetical protein
MTTVNRSALLWGPLLIVLGIGFLLNNFNLIPHDVFALWPLLVIGAGIWMLGGAVTRRRGRGLVGGTLVLALGLFWLLQNYGKVNDQMFLPVLLIGLGVGLLLRSLYAARR